MKLTLSKHLWRWAALAVAFFAVGFIVAQFLQPPANSQVIRGGKSLFHDSTPRQAVDQNILKKPEATYTAIIIAVIIISALVGYGYYREKRKK